MSVVLDASVLVALFVRDAHTEAALEIVEGHADTLLVSDFAAAEFASALAGRLRMDLLSEDEVRAALADFDAWSAAQGACSLEGDDIAFAASALRRLDLTLRTPDALHIGIAHRLSATLATFDQKMHASAEKLGVTVLP